MRLKQDGNFVLHCGDSLRTVELEAGTEISRTTLHAEPIYVVEDGRWKGWYFVASDRWVNKNTE